MATIHQCIFGYVGNYAIPMIGTASGDDGFIPCVIHHVICVIPIMGFQLIPMMERQHTVLGIAHHV